ncbi:MAG: hypothetical protein WCX82_00745 [archaeon]|jgi:exosortase/archaeosortase family protein
MNTKEKIIFIVSFVVAYALLLLLGVYVFGNFLVSGEEKIVHLILQNSVNYQAFDFVVYCSGIVSISAYLGVVIGFWVVTVKPKLKLVLASVIVLLLVNLLRIIAVMLSEKIGIEEPLHVFSWFLMGAVIVWLIKISYKK